MALCRYRSAVPGGPWFRLGTARVAAPFGTATWMVEGSHRCQPPLPRTKKGLTTTVASPSCTDLHRLICMYRSACAGLRSFQSSRSSRSPVPRPTACSGFSDLSPLTRGEICPSSDCRWSCRSIPAHAGRRVERCVDGPLALVLARPRDPAPTRMATLARGVHEHRYRGPEARLPTPPLELPRNTLSHREIRSQVIGSRMGLPLVTGRWMTIL